MRGQRSEVRGRGTGGGGQALVVAAMLAAAAACNAAALPAQDVFARYRDRVNEAVDRGLAHLAADQAPDGTFGGSFGRTTGVSSLAAMAFLAKGLTPGSRPYGETINRCLDYVLSVQSDTGYLGGEDGKMYSHNIATLLLLEVSGMVDPERQKRLDAAIPRAVKLILAAQQVRKPPADQGGWRYTPLATDSDLSCSGWALMALRSARLNGVPVPDKAIADAVAYIMRNHEPQTGQFGYRDKTHRSQTLTGSALLCLELTGHHGEESTLQAGRYILSIEKELARQSQKYYGIYYGAQATFQLGGVFWDHFGSWMYEYGLAEQRADGSWGKGAYETAMMVLAFTVPYRQLPIYQRDETVDEEEEPK